MKNKVLFITVLAALAATGCACAGSEANVSSEGGYISSTFSASGYGSSSSTGYSANLPSSQAVSSQASQSSSAASSQASSTSSKPSSAASSVSSSSRVSSQASSRASSQAVSAAFTPDSDWDWALILVNKNSLLSEDYEPQIAQYNSSRKFEARAVEYLSAMVKAAKADGIKLNVISSYRTYARQVELYDAKVKQFLNKGYTQTEAEQQAALQVAPPGTSEHCTGLATDIVSVDWYDNHSELTYDFDKTDEYRWLAAHAAEYGFVLRYPKGKEAVTMIDYEPWHYRFVGIDNAKYITENNLTLEEFVEMFDK